MVYCLIDFDRVYGLGPIIMVQIPTTIIRTSPIPHLLLLLQILIQQNITQRLDNMKHVLILLILNNS